MSDLVAPPWPRPLRYGLQALVYGAFAALIAIFSTHPPYQQRGADEAILKLSFSHSAQLRFACRERSAQELANTAPHMRTKLDCPRERALVRVQLDMDGHNLFRIDTPPVGLHLDGAATVYRRLSIPAGQHRFTARLADGPDHAFNFEHEQLLELAPGQVLIVDFSTARGGFVFTYGAS